MKIVFTLLTVAALTTTGAAHAKDIYEKTSSWKVGKTEAVPSKAVKSPYGASDSISDWRLDEGVKVTNGVKFSNDPEDLADSK